MNGSGWWWWWCNVVRDICLVHFGPLSTSWASFKNHNVPEYCCWPCSSFYDQCTHLMIATSSRIMHHLTNLKSSQTCFLNMTMTLLYSIGLHRPPDLNSREHICDVVHQDIHILDMQPTNLQQLRDAIMSTWTKISEECFNILLKVCLEELRQFWILIFSQSVWWNYYYYLSREAN